jgi:hypothetical protein
MASNFRIFIHRKNGKHYLNLKGDLDGSSAFELINVIKAHHGKAGTIVINTSDLSLIHPFGLSVFSSNCPINKVYHGLIFTGKYGSIMAPHETKLL